MRVKIKVTQEHINLGCMCSPRDCPVSLAIQDKLNTLSFIKLHCLVWRVECSLIPPEIKLKTEEIPLPKSAIRFISKFDDNISVEPFAFFIDIPEEFIKELK